MLPFIVVGGCILVSFLLFMVLVVPPGMAHHEFLVNDVTHGCSPPLIGLYITVAYSSVKQPWRLILKLFCNPAFSLLGESPYT